MYKLICGIFFSCTIVFGMGWQNIDELYEHLGKVKLSDLQDKQIKVLLKDYYRDLKIWWRNNKLVNDKVLRLFATDEFLNHKTKDFVQNNQHDRAKIDLIFLEGLYNILTKKQREELIRSFYEE
ncbi:hypothetical protein [Helicobacter anatolicus]|uniref:hypothetical protein n=1 Tax=Helicobacter anatolicus TaxID=2905874 RepID=UPI001E45E707|nr:hypothetical protein [Helicobacter anatolicus]MCE3038523.1 hypothetical protein [Helicobacter anatolicus]